VFLKYFCGPSGFQVIGAILGVNLIQYAFPKVGKGAPLSVGVHHGALAEGLASFLVVMVSVTLKKKEMKSFFMKTWITSIWKNTLHILSSDISGGIMNPASVSLSMTHIWYRNEYFAFEL
jgi:aquaporin SIP